MGRVKIDDGLNKSQRYRLKDVDGYRAKKRIYSSTESQKETRKLYMREWREKNREKHNATSRRTYFKKHELKKREQRINNILKYGISLLDYERMAKEQGGKCKICDKKPKKRKLGHRNLHIDHNHDNGKVRGLLCNRCNSSLGWHEKYEKSINSYLNVV